jgi:hypothetical protein
MVMRRIFESKRNKGTGKWRKLHIEYKDNEVGGACNKYGGKQRCIQSSGQETEGKDTTWKTQA